MLTLYQIYFLSLQDNIIKTLSVTKVVFQKSVLKTNGDKHGLLITQIVIAPSICLVISGLGDILFFPRRPSVCPSVYLSQIVSALQLENR